MQTVARPSKGKSMSSLHTFRQAFFSVVAGALLVSCGTPRHSGPIREGAYRAPIRVACVGDSITYGYGIQDRDHSSYPAQLSALLGKKWEVRNFGVNGATALKNGTRSYMQQPSFREALAYEPDVVIVKLGTNDTNARSWPSHKDEFLADYLAIIRNFSALKTKPRIYLCRPVPLFRDRGKEYDTDKILTEEVIPKINAAARQAKLRVIDLYVPFDGKAALFPDGVHPDAKGAGIMARQVYAKLLGKF
jgi:lysophospholipase L1-like esterase